MLPGHVPRCVSYVPIDFDREILEERLLPSGYDLALKTLFIWEGVTYYLSAPAVDCTLSFVAHSSGPGSSIIFDDAYAWVIDGTVKRGEVGSLGRNCALTGEAMVFGIPEGGLEEFMLERGYDQIKNVTGEDLKQMYFTGVNARRPEAPVHAIATALTSPTKPKTIETAGPSQRIEITALYSLCPLVEDDRTDLGESFSAGTKSVKHNECELTPYWLLWECR